MLCDVLKSALPLSACVAQRNALANNDGAPLLASTHAQTMETYQGNLDFSQDILLCRAVINEQMSGWFDKLKPFCARWSTQDCITRQPGVEMGIFTPPHHRTR